MTIIDRIFTILNIIVTLVAIVMFIAHGLAAGFFTALILGLPLMGFKWILTGRTGNKRDA